jgi:hypothetical protein
MSELTSCSLPFGERLGFVARLAKDLELIGLWEEKSSGEWADIFERLHATSRDDVVNVRFFLRKPATAGRAGVLVLEPRIVSGVAATNSEPALPNRRHLHRKTAQDRADTGENVSLGPRLHCLRKKNLIVLIDSS